MSAPRRVRRSARARKTAVARAVRRAATLSACARRAAVAAAVRSPCAACVQTARAGGARRGRGGRRTRARGKAGERASERESRAEQWACAHRGGAATYLRHCCASIELPSPSRTWRGTDVPPNVKTFAAIARCETAQSGYPEPLGAGAGKASGQGARGARRAPRAQAPRRVRACSRGGARRGAQVAMGRIADALAAVRTPEKLAVSARAQSLAAHPIARRALSLIHI